MARSVSVKLSRVAEELLGDVDALVANVLEEIVRALPDLARDPRGRELLASTVRDTIAAGLTVVSRGEPATEVAPPQAGLEMARRLAQQNFPITAMLRAYRLGQAAFQQELITRVVASRADAEEIASAAMALTAVAFNIVDLISEQVVAAYQAERDDWMRQRNAVRLARINALLASRTPDAGDTETALGYGLDGHHLAVVFWCGPDVDESHRLNTLERLVPRVAAAIGNPRPALVVAPDAATLWAWFPTPAPSVPAITEVLAPVPEVFAAVGDPAAGLAGFRLSHQRARQAQAIALAADPEHRLQVTAGSLLGPLTLLALAPESAADWVQSVLGELAEDDEAHARTRETLWAYLSSGGSLATAAAELHLHKNTIQYRIRKAEEARGRSLQEGRLEVEVALLACRLLGRTVLRRARDGE